jgi:hypothetical protein
LIRIKLDTTSLRDAATNLIIFVDEMHKEAKEKGGKPLVSEDTRYARHIDETDTILKKVVDTCLEIRWGSFVCYLRNSQRLHVRLKLSRTWHST